MEPDDGERGKRGTRTCERKSERERKRERRKQTEGDKETETAENRAGRAKREKGGDRRQRKKEEWKEKNVVCALRAPERGSKIEKEDTHTHREMQRQELRERGKKKER
jgi:hypothetical protein